MSRLVRPLITVATAGAMFLVQPWAQAAPPPPSWTAISTMVNGYGFFFAIQKTDGWVYANNTYSLEVKSTALPGGNTTITSDWTTPVFKTAARHAIFAGVMATSHQGTGDTGLAMVETARFCPLRAACGPQVALDMSSVPQMYEVGGTTISTDPVRKTITVLAGSKAVTGHVEWSWAFGQSKDDYADTTLTLAYGPAAAAYTQR